MPRRDRPRGEATPARPSKCPAPADGLPRGRDAVTPIHPAGFLSMIQRMLHSRQAVQCPMLQVPSDVLSWISLPQFRCSLSGDSLLLFLHAQAGPPAYAKVLHGRLLLLASSSAHVAASCLPGLARKSAPIRETDLRILGAAHHTPHEEAGRGPKCGRWGDRRRSSILSRRRPRPGPRHAPRRHDRACSLSSKPGGVA